jgi:hypothetical protein
MDEVWERFAPKDIALDNLKGAFYEVLFYFCFLKVTVFSKAEKIMRRESDRFEILPISGPIATTFYYRQKRFAPQIDADFVILFTSSEGEIHRPIFIDVKSSEPIPDEFLQWKAIGCAYMDCVFEVVWPKANKVKYPKEIDDWEYRTVCPHCNNLSKDYKYCDKCGNPLAWCVKVEKKE